MAKKQAQELAEQTLYKYADLVNYDLTNKILEIADKDIGKVSKQTLQNIGKWALNGADETEIAHNLELTPKQFNTFIQMCPQATYIMAQAKEMANVLVAGSLLETALGGKIVKKQQLVKISDFNDMGVKIGEHYEKMWVEEELPPNPNLLKYIAEHKLGEKFGDKPIDSDSKKFRKTLNNMTAEELMNIGVLLNDEN